MKIHFSDIKGGDPETAQKNHFLGASLELAVNSPGKAILDFILPSKGEGILSSSGLPPLEVSIEDSSGNKLFTGKASGTSKSPSPKSRSVRLIYHDPLYWELSDIAPYTYPSGTLSDICNALAKGKKVNFEVDPQLTHIFPAGGGIPIRCLDLLVQLVEQAGGYLVFNPKKNAVQVRTWTPTNPLSISQDQMVNISSLALDAASALTSMKVYGRKGLKNDWEETEVKPNDASLSIGQMGTEADAWVREASMMRTKTTIAHNRVPSASKQLASDLLSATLIRSVSGNMTLRNVSVLCGDTISIPESSLSISGDFIVEKIRYDFQSANVLAEIFGVRA